MTDAPESGQKCENRDGCKGDLVIPILAHHILAFLLDDIESLGDGAAVHGENLWVWRLWSFLGAVFLPALTDGARWGRHGELRDSRSMNCTKADTSRSEKGSMWLWLKRIQKMEKKECTVLMDNATGGCAPQAKIII